MTERGGALRLIEGDVTLGAGELVAEPVLSLPVAGEGEGGLLGVALDPSFPRTRRFFLYRTAADLSQNTIERFFLDDEGRRERARGPRVAIDGASPAQLERLSRKLVACRVREGVEGTAVVENGHVVRASAAPKNMCVERALKASLGALDVDDGVIPFAVTPP